MIPWDSIEIGFEKFLELLGADERVRTEFELSRPEFFAEAATALLPGAERRHLEWFLLERPCAALGAVPAVAWMEAWRARLPVEVGELAPSFLQSLPGAFEVTSVVQNEGLWVRDLFTQGEHPIAEPAIARAIAEEDLLVGRLFPSGGGTFLLSPSVALFRNPTLLEAVRVDLAKMRHVRRGVLRVQQLELERLFHGPGSATAPDVPTEEIRKRVRENLLELGLDVSSIEDILIRVRRAARTGAGREVTEILNTLAFDTGVDLSSARLVLVELWDQERLVGARSEVRPGQAPAKDDGDENEVDAHAALAAFDRGRAEGKDLEVLFRQLEQDLGVDDEEPTSEEEDLGAPDFPGVVAAMVTEFLWEVEREQGPERARRWEVLRELGHYGQDIGVFEELGEVRLLDFAARWLLDESPLRNEDELRTVLEALAAFCRWCEEQHDLALESRFGATLSQLAEAVPRHARLRRLASSGPGLGAYRVLSVLPDQAHVADRAGRELTLELTVPQAENLRDGDLVRVATEGTRSVLGHGYPGELASALF